MSWAREIDPGVVHPAGELAELRGDAARRLARRPFSDIAHHRDNRRSCLTPEGLEAWLVDIDRDDPQASLASSSAIARPSPAAAPVTTHERIGGTLLLLE